MTKAGRNAWLAVMGTVALFYLALMPLVLERLNPVTGDEPFYIMTAISMVRDRDLDESNNYNNRDYTELYPADPLPANWRGWPAFPRTLPPHPAVSEQDGLFTKHALGLSILIAMPYELGGRVAAMLVVLACGVLLAGQMFLFARESGAPDYVAMLAALALSISLPLAPYSLLLFPEVPAALLILFAIRRLALDDNSTVQWLALGAAVGFLPWLHQRFGVMSIVFAIFILVRLWRNRTIQPALALIPVALGGISIITYNMWLYGQPTQNTEDHAGFSGITGTLNGAAGLVLDAQWGLFVAAPVMLVALSAIPVWYAHARRAVLICGFAVAPYLLVVAAYQVWWGEWGPPARYLVPVVPLLAAPLAAWLRVATRWQWATAGGAWLVGLLLTIIGFANPQRFYHHPNGLNNLYSWLDERTGTNLSDRLVAYQFYAPDGEAQRIGLPITALVVMLLLSWWVTHSSNAVAKLNNPNR